MGRTMGSPGSRGIRAALLVSADRSQLGGTMNRAGLLAMALLAGTVGLAQVSTGWISPSADSGAFSNGSRAYALDNVNYATAAHGAVHRYWGYNFSIPAGSAILGIEVRVVFRKTGAPGAYLGVELSWNGGGSWTATGFQAGPAPRAWRSFVLGGTTVTWDRAWTAEEFTPTAFRVRLTAVNGLDLDWVAVRVYYRVEGAPTLAVTPQVVDLGALTLADYDAGYKETSPAQRLAVSSASAWSLYVEADDPTWIYTGSDPDPAKPCTHLEWRVVAYGPGITGPQTTYVGLSVVSQRVAGGSAGTGLWLDIGLRVRVDYTTTVPGTYELRFTYTLTAP